MSLGLAPIRRATSLTMKCRIFCPSTGVGRQREAAHKLKGWKKVGIRIENQEKETMQEGDNGATPHRSAIYGMIEDVEFFW